MMKPRVALDTAATRREWVFSFLTLDVVRAFYDMMGLGPSLQAGLHGALREATLLTRKEIVQALVSGGAKPTLASFCRHVESLVGPAATEHLAWWLQHVFYDEVQAHLVVSHWTDVLRHCLREGDEVWRQLPFPKRLSDEASRRFAAAIDSKEYYQRCEDLEAHPLSDWDLHMYASNTYDFEEDREGAWPNPFTVINLTAGNYQEYQFWAWALRVLSADEQTRLRDKALEIVRAAELTWIKDLVHPSTLDIGL